MSQALNQIENSNQTQFSSSVQYEQTSTVIQNQSAANQPNEDLSLDQQQNFLRPRINSNALKQRIGRLSFSEETDNVEEEQKVDREDIKNKLNMLFSQKDIQRSKSPVAETKINNVEMKKSIFNPQKRGRSIMVSQFFEEDKPQVHKQNTLQNTASFDQKWEGQTSNKIQETAEEFCQASSSDSDSDDSDNENENENEKNLKTKGQETLDLNSLKQNIEFTSEKEVVIDQQENNSIQINSSQQIIKEGVSNMLIATDINENKFSVIVQEEKGQNDQLNEQEKQKQITSLNQTEQKYSDLVQNQADLSQKQSINEEKIKINQFKEQEKLEILTQNIQSEQNKTELVQNKTVIIESQKTEIENIQKFEIQNQENFESSNLHIKEQEISKTEEKKFNNQKEQLSEDASTPKQEENKAEVQKLDEKQQEIQEMKQQVKSKIDTFLNENKNKFKQTSQIQKQQVSKNGNQTTIEISSGLKINQSSSKDKNITSETELNQVQISKTNPSNQFNQSLNKFEQNKNQEQEVQEINDQNTQCIEVPCIKISQLECQDQILQQEENKESNKITQSIDENTKSLQQSKEKEELTKQQKSSQVQKVQKVFNTEENQKNNQNQQEKITDIKQNQKSNTQQENKLNKSEENQQKQIEENKKTGAKAKTPRYEQLDLQKTKVQSKPNRNQASAEKEKVLNKSVDIKKKNTSQIIQKFEEKNQETIKVIKNEKSRVISQNKNQSLIPQEQLRMTQKQQTNKDFQSQVFNKFNPIKLSGNQSARESSKKIKKSPSKQTTDNNTKCESQKVQNKSFETNFASPAKLQQETQKLTNKNQMLSQQQKEQTSQDISRRYRSNSTLVMMPIQGQNRMRSLSPEACIVNDPLTYKLKVDKLIQEMISNLRHYSITLSSIEKYRILCENLPKSEDESLIIQNIGFALNLMLYYARVPGLETNFLIDENNPKIDQVIFNLSNTQEVIHIIKNIHHSIRNKSFDGLQVTKIWYYLKTIELQKSQIQEVCRLFLNFIKCVFHYYDLMRKICFDINEENSFKKGKEKIQQSSKNIKETEEGSQQKAEIISFDFKDEKRKSILLRKIIEDQKEDLKQKFGKQNEVQSEDQIIQEKFSEFLRIKLSEELNFLQKIRNFKQQTVLIEFASNKIIQRQDSLVQEFLSKEGQAKTMKFMKNKIKFRDLVFLLTKQQVELLQSKQWNHDYMALFSNIQGINKKTYLLKKNKFK